MAVQTEWSNYEDLYTPICQQDKCFVLDIDEDTTIDPYRKYLVIPVSDEAFNSKDEDDIPVSIRHDILMSGTEWPIWKSGIFQMGQY
jgi:hypothetical protein